LAEFLEPVNGGWLESMVLLVKPRRDGLVDRSGLGRSEGLLLVVRERVLDSQDRVTSPAFAREEFKPSDQFACVSFVQLRATGDQEHDRRHAAIVSEPGTFARPLIRPARSRETA
jgi:hypothetical protein